MPSNTKAIVANSLTALIKTRTLDQIKIKDITDHCGFNRQTFYYHFHDIYDLLEWIVRQELEIILTSKSEFKNWHEVIKHIFTKMIKNKSLYRNIYASMNITWVRTLLEDFSQPLVSIVLKSYAKEVEISSENFSFLVEYYSLIIMSMTLQWLADGMPEDRIKDIEKYLVIMDGSIEWALKKFSTKR